MTGSSVHQLVADIYGATSAEEYHSGLQRALASFDELNTRTMASSGVKLACGEGCSLCCWLRVDVFAHEVFLIAHHIGTSFSEAELSGVLSRLSMHAYRVMPIEPFDHATQNVVCPLLQNGRCGVYAVRPKVCRRQHSKDLAACQYTFENPTDLNFPGAHDRELFTTLSEAMGWGLRSTRSLDSTVRFTGLERRSRKL